MPERSENRNWLNAEWAGQLSQVLESMTGEKPEVKWKPESQGEQSITLGWEQSLNTGAE
jgi:hypothetical protein